MPDCLGIDLLKDGQSEGEGAIVAKKLSLILLGLVALGYLGYSFGELFPFFPEAKVVGAVLAIVSGILARRYEQSLPQPVHAQCHFCAKWVDIMKLKSFQRMQEEKEAEWLCCPLCESYDYPFRHGWSPVERQTA